MVVYFVGREDFDFVRFENTASCINNNARRCWLEPTLSACLRFRALIGVYLLCCLCGLTALHCAVLCRAVVAEQRKKINSGRFLNKEIILRIVGNQKD